MSCIFSGIVLRCWAYPLVGRISKVQVGIGNGSCCYSEAGLRASRGKLSGLKFGTSTIAEQDAGLQGREQVMWIHTGNPKL